MDRFVSGFEGTDRYVDQRGIEIMVSVKGIPAAHWAMVATLPTAEALPPSKACSACCGRRCCLALAGVLIGWLVWRLLKRQLCAGSGSDPRAWPNKADTGDR